LIAEPRYDSGSTKAMRMVQRGNNPVPQSVA